MTLDEILRDIEKDESAADFHCRHDASHAVASWLRDRERLRSAVLALRAAEEAVTQWRNKGSHHFVSEDAMNELDAALSSLKDVK